MKSYLIVILKIIIINVSIYSQNNFLNQKSYQKSNSNIGIDTSDFFPCAIGNYWEYDAFTINGTIIFRIKIIGDTVLPNGKIYNIFEKKYLNPNGYNEIWYCRKDTNKIYYIFQYAECPDGEYLQYDFSLPDSSAWNICRDNGHCGNAMGVSKTYYDNNYYEFFNRPVETKEFENVYLDSTGATWTPCETSIIYIGKGIGIVRQFIFNEGDFTLKGAIINGAKFGTITNIKNSQKTKTSEFSIEVYPNPFNNSSNLKGYLPESGEIDISLYNLLGQKVKTIFKGTKSSGDFLIHFNVTGLSSGIYFIFLKYNSYIVTNKIILLK